MADTLRYKITKKDIDANNDVSDERTFSFDETFTEKLQATFQQASGAGFTAFTFQGITTATSMRIQSDQSITCKFNSGSDELVVNKNLIWEGSFTALTIENTSGSTATITVELYENT